MTLNHEDLVKEAKRLGKAPPERDLIDAVNQLIPDLVLDLGIYPYMVLISEKGGVILYGNDPDHTCDFRLEMFNRGDYWAWITDSRREFKECIGKWK